MAKLVTLIFSIIIIITISVNKKVATLNFLFFVKDP